MKSVCENQSLDNGSTEPDEGLSYPFVCGICTEKFDNLGMFVLHFRAHGPPTDKTLHVCSCLYDIVPDSDDRKNNEPYKCRTCNVQFISICALHSHALKCSADGSYIFDNSKRMVYPLSLHCSYFESRENDNYEDVDESNEKKAVNDLSDSSSTDAMSRAEKVDHILRTVCKLFEKGETDKTANISSIVDMEVKRKRGRPRKYDLTEEKPDITKVKKANVFGIDDMEFKHKRGRPRKYDLTEEKPDITKVKKANVSSKDEKEVKCKRGRPRKHDLTEEKPEQVTNEIEEKVEATEIIENHIVVKVEVEENNSCDRTQTFDIDNSSKHVDILGQSEDHSVNTAEYDDLTDEYTPESNTELKKKLQRNKKCLKKKTSVNKKQISKELHNQNSKERRKRLKDSRNDSSTPKRRPPMPTEECPHCGKILKPYIMKVHLRSHSSERPFLCDLCPRTYKHQKHLEVHKATHQDVKPFYCEICGKGYLTITMLKHHSMMHHSDSRPCVCNLCGASFITNYKLKRHMRSHTGEKSEQCDLCGMGFSTRYNLSVHIQCVHKRVHRFTCKECGKEFMTNYQLKVHTMRHSGERPYKCAICKAEYIERKELRRHLKKQHNQQLEENTNPLSELLEIFNTAKTITSDVTQQQIASFQAQAYDQVLEHTEASTASEFITTGSETVFSYTPGGEGDESNSAPYYPDIKTSNVKVLPVSQYSMVYPSTPNYHYDNSARELSLPLPVQEMHENSSFHLPVNEHSNATDLSKIKEEKINLNGSTQHEIQDNKLLVNPDKDEIQNTAGHHNKIDANFTVL